MGSRNRPLSPWTSTRAVACSRRGRCHVSQFARTHAAITAPMPVRPRIKPAELVSSVPTTMWFMFRANPVTTTMVTWTTRNPRNLSSPKKWSERAAWRFPNRRLYQRKWLSIAGDMASPVRIWRGARTKTTPK